MNAVLLIGGFGTRLRPLTLAKPKALLPVLNRPFLGYQLDLLKEAGVTNVMLACGRHSRPWQRALRALAPRGLAVHFAFEPEPLGTAGAVRFAYGLLKKKTKKTNAPVLVFNGDVFFDLPVDRFLGFHSANNAACTVALTQVQDPSRFGVVDIDVKGRVRQFLEKPKPPFPSYLINAGAYLLNADWIEKIPPGRAVSIEKESFPQSLAHGDRLFGFTMSGYWNDIGTHQSYLQAHKHILSTNNRWTAHPFFRKRGGVKTTPAGRCHLLVGQRSFLRKSISLEGFVCCGNDVFVGENVTLRDCVILDGCRIEDGAVVAGAVLGRACRIGAHAQVREGSVLGDKTIIPSYTRC